MSLPGRFRVLLGVLSILVFLAADSVYGAPLQNVIYVRHDAPGNNSGSSWDDAYTDLQDALGVAQADDEIWVAQGVYYPAGDALDRTATFELQDSVALYGGFAGTESERDQRNWETNVTVLSGDLDRNDTTDEMGVVTDTVGIMGRNAYHVLTADSLGGTTVLDGFAVTAGLADGTDQRAYGGGMYNSGSNPTLTNVVFSGNRAEWYGGGMSNRSSNPDLTNVTFLGNEAADRGGGMYNLESSPTLTDVTFTNNSATGTHRYGGGMLNWNSSPRLTRVGFRENRADYGGGMYSYYSDPTLTDVTFIENTAEEYGGGMYSYYYSSPNLTNVAFVGNQAHNGGGMMYNRYSNPTFANVIFNGNQAVNGGGMYGREADATIINVRFTGNKADHKGGGMCNLQNSPTLTNVTFSSNQAGGGGGGGMYNYDSSPLATNCILWGNAATLGAQIHNEGISAPLVMYSDIEGGYSGEGNINSDPGFVAPVAASSAPTSTGNYRLTEGSPAVDVGTNDMVTAGTDLDGNPRIADGTGDGNAVVDMGAYELQIPLLTIIKEGEGLVTSTPGSIDCGDVCTSRFLTGTPVSVTATADTGWTFESWSGEVDSTENPVALTMDADKSVTATFSQNEYALDVNTVGQGTVTREPDQTIYHYGDVVTLTATADPGWTFQGWSGDVDSTDNPLEVVVEASTAITATFTQDEYTLNVSTVGEGNVDIDPEEATYVYGDVVTLTAIAEPAWSFEGWSGDIDSTENPLVFVVEGDTAIVATFKAKVYIPLVLANY